MFCRRCSVFSDPESERFCGRSVFRIDRSDVNAEMVGSWFGQVAHKFDIEWDIFDTSVPKKVVIMVSKFDTALTTALQVPIGALPMEVTVITLTTRMRPLADAMSTISYPCFEGHQNGG